jgi:hypothetical protein
MAIMSALANWRPAAPIGFPGACVRLGVALLGLGLVAAPLNYQRVGWSGVSAVAVAAGVCWAGGMMALAVAAWSSGPLRGLYAVLGGMMFRCLLPLATGVYLQKHSRVLAEAGVGNLILVFYLLTLVVEVWLLLALLGPATKAG